MKKSEGGNNILREFAYIDKGGHKMPIKTQGDLPVKEILERENIFVMDEKRAMHQDIRPFRF